MNRLRQLVGRRWWLVAGLVVLVAVAGVASWWAIGGGGDARWSAGADGSGSAELGEPDPSAGPDDPAGPGTDTDGGQPAGPAAVPPPYVQPFAQQPGVAPQRPQSTSSAGVEIAEGTDGCDHAYGDRSICVPWQFPAGVTDKCEWLKTHGFKPLEITGGRDRHGLDRNSDGTACGDGD